ILKTEGNPTALNHQYSVSQCTNVLVVAIISKPMPTSHHIHRRGDWASEGTGRFGREEVTGQINANRGNNRALWRHGRLP
ncbi:MAG: hypothetical protein AAGB19_19665, partial [Cyanobacteria bacterium P01_F01_bin.3]